MIRVEDVLRYYNFENFGNNEHRITPEELFKLDDACFIDVRSREEMDTIAFPLHHHVKSLEIPICDIPDSLDKIPRDKVVGIFCAATIRASMVFVYLKSMGYDNVKIIVGGYEPMFLALNPGLMYTYLQNKRNRMDE